LISLILGPVLSPKLKSWYPVQWGINNLISHLKTQKMRKADLINNISEKTGIPKVDVLVALETMFKEVKESLAQGENIYIRGFGSFITKKRAAKIGRNIKKNTAVHIPAHFIPAFKPAKEFVQEVKKLQLDTAIKNDGAEEMI
jgi:DNA-binding protein HU-beta